MKRKWSGSGAAAAMIAMAVLATGCKTAVPAVSDTVAEESGTAVEEGWAILEESLEAARQEMESSLEEKEESLKAVEESIEEARESLEGAEESLQALEESLKAAEEAAALDGRVPYEQLMSSPAVYQQKRVRFSGRIIRVARSGNTYGQLVLAVDGDAGRKLVCEYDRSGITPPLAVSDQVQVDGLFTGILQYRLDTGISEDLPTITVKEFEQIWRVAPETTAQPPEGLSDQEAWADAESSAASAEGTGTEGTGTAIPDEMAVPETAVVPPTEAPYMGGPGMQP